MIAIAVFEIAISTQNFCKVHHNNPFSRGPKNIQLMENMQNGVHDLSCWPEMYESPIHTIVKYM